MLIFVYFTIVIFNRSLIEILIIDFKHDLADIVVIWLRSFNYDPNFSSFIEDLDEFYSTNCNRKMYKYLIIISVFDGIFTIYYST